MQMPQLALRFLIICCDERRSKSVLRDIAVTASILFFPISDRWSADFSFVTAQLPVFTFSSEKMKFDAEP
eukprot:IDg11518t1